MNFREIVDDTRSIDQPSPEALGVASAGATIGMRLAKLVVITVVVVGLVIAGRSSIVNWRSASEKIDVQVREIDAALLNETDIDRQDALRDQREALKRGHPSLRNLNWTLIATASGLYALGLLPSAMLLRRAVISFGGRPRLSTVVTAQLLGHLGKYVPGKAMVLVLRGGVLARDGVRPMTSTISVFLETFMMMAVGAVVAAAATTGMPVPRWIMTTAIITALLAGVPTIPIVVRIVAARVTRVNRQTLESDINWSLFFAGWGWSLLSWMLIGASFTSLVIALPSVEPHPSWINLYPIATAAISLAMVVGFASLLPGGAGVRELVVTTMLGIAIGTAQGLLAAIAARITFMVIEVGLAAVCWVWLRQTRRTTGETEPL